MTGRYNGINGTFTTTLATRKRALEIGAAFIENDLAKLRHDAAEGERAQILYDQSKQRDELSVGAVRPDTRPVTTSHEADVMKAMEWASASATLRVLASLEDGS